MLGGHPNKISRFRPCPQEDTGEKRARELAFSATVELRVSDVNVYAHCATTTLAPAFTKTLGVGNLTIRQKVVYSFKRDVSRLETVGPHAGFSLASLCAFFDFFGIMRPLTKSYKVKKPADNAFWIPPRRPRMTAAIPAADETDKYVYVHDDTTMATEAGKKKRSSAFVPRLNSQLWTHTRPNPSTGPPNHLTLTPIRRLPSLLANSG